MDIDALDSSQLKSWTVYGELQFEHSQEPGEHRFDLVLCEASESSGSKRSLSDVPIVGRISFMFDQDFVMTDSVSAATLADIFAFIDSAVTVVNSSGKVFESVDGSQWSLSKGYDVYPEFLSSLDFKWEDIIHEPLAYTALQPVSLKERVAPVQEMELVLRPETERSI